MTKLGDAVKATLASRGHDVDLARIEQILVAANVSSTASRGVPARLRIRRLHVTGTKHYSDALDGPHSDIQMKVEPLNLDWMPRNGVNGVGSEVNLRGKSSVLQFATWALTGRSHLQTDVLSWVAQLSAEFHIDDVPVFVSFAVQDGMPTGRVEQAVPSGRAVLGTFSGHAEFEALMSSVMLERLRLDAISVFAKGVETEHEWPSYAAALRVQADKLDPIVGNENTLKTRILQMFVGTSWAAADAKIATALNALQFEREATTAKHRSTAAATTTALEAAENRVRAARASLDELDPSLPDVDEVLALAAAAAARAKETHDVSWRLMTARTAISEAKADLRAEEVRRQAVAEDAVARRLFNGMSPTVCPRCSTKVAAERYAAELTEHECSLCASDLELDAMVDASSASPERASPTIDDEGDEEDVDPVDALREAVAEAETDIAQLEQELRRADRSRLDAEATALRARNSLESARSRMQAELELARAEGALGDRCLSRRVVPADAGCSDR